VIITLYSYSWASPANSARGNEVPTSDESGPCYQYPLSFSRLMNLCCRSGHAVATAIRPETLRLQMD